MKAHPHLEVNRVRNGKGIVANSHFLPGRRICRIEGKVVTSGQVLRYWQSEPKRGANCFRYSADHYIDPQGEIGQYANHSCAPNAGIIKVGRHLFMRAIRPIEKGEEITHDYSTLLGTDDVWSMRCKCGERGCRRIVSDVSTIPNKIMKKYMRLGIVPDFILETIEH